MRRTMPRGRPRKTDPNVVLDTAMKAFWERGFDGTSMNDLAEKPEHAGKLRELHAALKKLKKEMHDPMS